MTKLMRILFLAGSVALLLAGCGSGGGGADGGSSQCNPSNCNGCCDASGTCRTSADATCGAQGAACADCSAIKPTATLSGGSCVNGQCVEQDCGPCRCDVQAADGGCVTP